MSVKEDIRQQFTITKFLQTSPPRLVGRAIISLATTAATLVTTCVESSKHELRVEQAWRQSQALPSKPFLDPALRKQPLTAKQIKQREAQHPSVIGLFPVAARYRLDALKNVQSVKGFGMNTRQMPEALQTATYNRKLFIARLETCKTNTHPSCTIHKAIYNTLPEIAKIKDQRERTKAVLVLTRLALPIYAQDQVTNYHSVTSINGAIQEKRGICIQFAQLAQILAERVGQEANLVSGYKVDRYQRLPVFLPQDGGGHIFTAVNIGGGRNVVLEVKGNDWDMRHKMTTPDLIKFVRGNSDLVDVNQYMNAHRQRDSHERFIPYYTINKYGAAPFYGGAKYNSDYTIDPRHPLAPVSTAVSSAIAIDRPLLLNPQLTQRLLAVANSHTATQTRLQLLPAKPIQNWRPIQAPRPSS